jgi:hypothetical protein
MLESFGNPMKAAALVGAFLLVRCGGDTRGSRPKIDAGVNAGGAATGVGGSSTGTATGGYAGAQLCLKTPAVNTHIADFTQWDNGNWGYAPGDLVGGQSPYQSDSSATVTASVDTSLPDPYLKLTATIPSGGYTGYVMWFGTCVDASKYSGIQFKVKGKNFGSCTLDFQVQTSTNYPIDGKNLKGECMGDWTAKSADQLVCKSNHAAVTVTLDWTTASFPWNHLQEGQPVAIMDPSDILGIQFQVSAATGVTCPGLELDLDTIEFFPPP